MNKFTLNLVYRDPTKIGLKILEYKIYKLDVESAGIFHGGVSVRHSLSAPSSFKNKLVNLALLDSKHKIHRVLLALKG